MLRIYDMHDAFVLYIPADDLFRPFLQVRHLVDDLRTRCDTVYWTFADVRSNYKALLTGRGFWKNDNNKNTSTTNYYYTTNNNERN